MTTKLFPGLPHRNRVTLRRTFTLIELLVVVSIIAILASMLLPMLSHARFMAKRVVCLNNQKQIYLATFTYEEDFQNLMPTLGVPKLAFGFGQTGHTGKWRNRPISLGLLAWNDYITVQKVLACADTEFVPLRKDRMDHYPFLHDNPLYAEWTFHRGHRPPFAIPMKGQQNFPHHGYWYAGASSYAFRRRGDLGDYPYPPTNPVAGQWQWMSLPNEKVNESKVTLDTINCKTIMVCNQRPGDRYETCHQGRGSNLLFRDGSAKWGDFGGVQLKSNYSFSWPDNTMWDFAEAQ